jgi:hypothetical protein
MNTDFEVEVGKMNVGNNGSNMSLRSLVAKTEKAMHGMSSRFGDVNALKSMLEKLLGVLATQKEVLGQEVRVLSANDVAIKAFLEIELNKLRQSVIVDQKNTNAVNDMVRKEIEEVQRLERKFDEQLAKVEAVINKRLSKQRYLWCGVGVLVLSLVGCLGYLCNELKDLTGKMEKMQVNIGSSMAEVKGIVLMSSQTKIGQQKDINDRRKNK